MVYPHREDMEELRLLLNASYQVKDVSLKRVNTLRVQLNDILEKAKVRRW